MPATERLIPSTLRMSNIETGEILAAQWESFQKCIPYSPSNMQIKDDITRLLTGGSNIELAVESQVYSSLAPYLHL